jgi:hypothetical protein
MVKNMPRAAFVLAISCALAPVQAQVGISDVKWDSYVFRMVNGSPRQVLQDGKLIGIFRGNQIILLSGADATAVQKSFDDLIAARTRGDTPGGPGTPTPPAASDKVTWSNGEPQVQLADGWQVAFLGGNGSRIDARLPSGEKVHLQFTEAAKGPAGVAKGLGVFVASVGQKTSSLEGGAWAASVAQGGPGQFYNQNNGTRNYKNVIPPWAQQAAAAALRAERLVGANTDGPKYAFTGTGKLAEVSGPAN